MSNRDPADRAVAIVGVGAVLPDAFDAQTFWQNVLTGKDSITEVPPERWDPRDYFDPDPKAMDKTYSKIGGWVRGFDFDPIKLRIPPKVAAAMDEGQKWVLAASVEALKDAGHPDRPLDLDRTAVIVGNAMGGELHYTTALRVYVPEYVHALETSPAFQGLPEATRRALVDELVAGIRGRTPEITEDSMPGELANVMAGRVAAVLNLRGPNYTTDAACASSLAALESAVLGLVDHHYDAALAGGMDRNMGAPTFVKFCKIGALSATGSRPYAKGADGFVMGEGGAMFLLKRLADAERDGDRIYGVVRAVGASSDGKGKGITAPNPKGQILAVRRAWDRAGLPMGSMTLLEGHGTSTRVGDMAEIEAISEVLAGTGAGVGAIALGSVKSQIGHLKSGAGAAGLLKAALALHHQILPPSINFHEPNPGVDFSKSPFFVNTQARPWERPANAPRRAGLSAFGFGGTNFHVVLEEHVPGMLTSRKPLTQVPENLQTSPGGAAVQTSAAPLGGLLSLGGREPGELATQLEAALAAARDGRLPPREPASDEVRSAPERLVIAFDDAAELVAKGEKALKALAKNDPRAWRVLQSKGVHRAGGRPGKLAFLFPGQGSQYLNMLRALKDLDPVVAETVAEADEALAQVMPRPLSSYVYIDSAEPAVLDAAEKELRHTTITQPAVLTVDVALLRLLAKYGIEPDFVMGHSLGEWGAAVAAGIVPFKDALMCVSARAQNMAKLAPPDPGKMASVLGPHEEIVARLAQIDGYIVPANINSRNQTVIAGGSDAVDRAIELFRAEGYTAQQIPVSHAFHSEIVAGATDALREFLTGVDLKRPRIPVVGNVEGDFYPDDVAAIRELLARQIAAPVQFVKGLDSLYAAGARVFVEVGPKRVLQTFAENVLADRDDVTCLSTNHPKRGDVASFHEALCGIYAQGMPAPAPTSVHRVTAPAAAALTVHAPAAAAAGLSAAPAAAATGFAAPGASAPAPATSGPLAANGAPDYEGMGRLFARFLDEGLSMYRGQPAAPAPQPARGSVVISGAGLGLPGASRRVFDDANVDRILAGESFLEPIPTRIREQMVDKNILRVVKREVGEPSLDPIANVDEVIKLAARRGAFDLAVEFGVPAERIAAYDVTTGLAIGAAIEALRDAGIPLVRHYRRTTTGSLLPGQWLLPRSMADETGVIFASAFPGYNRLIDEITAHHADRLRSGLAAELKTLRDALPADDPALARIDGRLAELESGERYGLDRKFLFKILAMGHSQLAEMIGARGPNTQVNAACASTTLAVSLAEDWIRAGRCRRVVVLAADDVTSDEMLEWVAAGFLATGAATTEATVERAALPFDRRRHGMLLGMGACGLVIEAQDALAERGMRGIGELLATETANSAFHGTRLDIDHISSVMERLVSTAERRYGLDRAAVARELVFISHETYTPARGGSAAAEVHALRRTFGPGADSVVVCNTKGLTGHPMGVGIEDAITAKVLERQIVPAVPNFKEPDPELGTLNLSQGGHYPVQYALRLAAGFGSQISMTLTRRIPGVEERVAAPEVYRQWLADVSGLDAAELEVVQRTLRVKDTGRPAREPAASRWTFGTPPREAVFASNEVAHPAAAAARAPVHQVASDGAHLAAAPQATAAAAAEHSAPAAAAQPASPAAAPQAIVPAAASTEDPVAERVLGVVSEKTGYPRDMLEMDLDLEADLGIDTVKQAEVFAEVREAFGIPRQDDLSLRDYPTLAAVIGYVRKHRPDLAAPPAPVASAAAQAAPAAGPAAGLDAAGLDPVAEKVLELVSEKTGYPRDMLEMDLDLEADLGIDTVKQAEVFSQVRETFDIPRQDDLSLRDYPTLASVVGFVRQHRPDLAAAPAPAASAQATAPQAPAPGGAPLDEIAEKVLALVSDKTGYPRDMLELDLDMEADLGIDTVKQAEVFSQVREAFGIPRKDDLSLRDYPTLGDVIRFVEEHRPSAGVPDTAAEATDTTAGAEPAAGAAAPLFRVPTPLLRPDLDLCKATGARLEAGARVVLVADHGGVAEALTARLASQGVEVLRMEPPADPRALEAQLAEWAAVGPLAGAYFLPALDPEPALEAQDLEAWRALHRDRVQALHALARALYEALSAEGSFLVAGTRLGGLHGYAPGGAVNPSGGAVTGFVKAFGRERPACLAKAVDFAAEDAADDVALALLAETERDPGAVEIGYADGLRWAIGVVEETIGRPEAADGMALDQDTVFLVTGGAGAITSAIVQDLATHSRGTFHLLDALPAPSEAMRGLVARLAADRDGLKREIFEELKASGERATPALVERRLFAIERAGAILDAVQAVEAAGAKARYHTCDVTRAEAVRSCVQAIQEESGRLDVIVHAAGIERSRSLDVKPVEEFDLVFAVKSDGLFNLLSETRDLAVRGLVCFSSVAGRFGNAGQTDYSAGNDLMCKVAPSWAAARPDRRAVILDWTAWGGIGMATRGNIPEIMRRAGIEMLAPADGLPVVRRMLTEGRLGETVVGRRLGILLEGRDADGGVDPEAVKSLIAEFGPRALSFEDVTFDPHRGVEALVTLDPKAEPFLEDHRIDGTAVLPGVMGIEGFAQVASLLAPAVPVRTVEDVRFLAPLKFYRDEQRSAVFRALPLRDADGAVRVHTALTSSRPVVGSKLPPEEKVHFTGTVVLGVSAVTPEPLEHAADQGAALDREDIYRVYFHGPAYRVLSKVHPTDRGVAGRLCEELPIDTGSPDAATLFAPRLIELCFQTAGVWEIGSTGRLGLPAAADRVTVHDLPAAMQALVAEVAVREDDGQGLCFDARVRGDDGRVYVDVEGYRTSQLPSRLPEDELAPFRVMVKA